MKDLTACLLPVVLSASFLFAPLAFAAAPTGFLANTADFKATGTVSEGHIERLAVGSDPDAGRFIYINLSGKLRATVKANLAGVDISQFTENTPVAFSFGAFNFTGTLKGDPKFVPGKKSAKFVIKEIFQGRSFDTGTVNFAWTAKVLTVSLTNEPFFAEAVVTDFLGVAPEFNKLFTSTGKDPVSVGIAGVTGTRTVVYTIKAITPEKTFNLGANGVETEFCNSASIAGGFDVKAPVLKSKFPTTATPAPFDLSLEFTESDLLVEATLTVDGAAATLTAIGVDNTSQPGKHFVNITGLTLLAGTHKLVLTVRDESGNVATLKKSIKVQ